MSWQLEIYSNSHPSDSEKVTDVSIAGTTENESQKAFERRVARLIDIARVQHHLYMVCPAHACRTRIFLEKKIVMISNFEIFQG